IYAPGTPQTKCSGGPDIAPALTPQNKDKIIADLKGKATVPPQGPEPKDDLDLAKQPRYLDGALQKAYTELQSQKYSAYFKRAVLVIGNGGFAQDPQAQFNCGQVAPPDLADKAHTAQVNRVDTYVMQLTTHPAPLSQDASILGDKGGTGAAS